LFERNGVSVNIRPGDDIPTRSLPILARSDYSAPGEEATPEQAVRWL